MIIRNVKTLFLWALDELPNCKEVIMAFFQKPKAAILKWAVRIIVQLFGAET